MPLQLPETQGLCCQRLLGSTGKVGAGLCPYTFWAPTQEAVRLALDWSWVLKESSSGVCAEESPECLFHLCPSLPHHLKAHCP